MRQPRAAVARAGSREQGCLPLAACWPARRVALAPPILLR